MIIAKFFLDKARYRAEDNSGKLIWVEIDYWGNKFSLSTPNRKLENLAKNLLKRKHRVDFAEKLVK